jgi:signal transduction histidine kinase
VTIASQDKDLLWFLAEGTSGTVGEEFFQRLVEHTARAFRADVAFVAEIVPEDHEYARFLACWEGGRLTDLLEYCLAGTPCAEVVGADVVSYPVGVMERFPQDTMVIDMGLDGYLAVPLRGSGGEHIGHLGVLSRAPLYPDEEKLAALRIFAARASAELERRRHEARLHALIDEQAALRRVATLVAAEAPQQDVLDAIVREVAELMRTDTAGLLRLDDDQVTIVSGISSVPDCPVPVGLTAHVDRFSATRDAVLTGRPSRSDAQRLNAPERTPELRALGLQSAVAAPITVAGRVWGALAIARSSADPMPPSTEVRLGDFAELAAQAIANADAREQLAASRTRIVQTADAERRRIERNLHDGAQQRLVAMALSLRLAQGAVAGDPRAAGLLAQASEELQLTLQELRELARGIHPAVLSDRGLDVALDALAQRCSVPVDLTLPGIRLPQAVEATAYYLVAESRTNVAMYANASGVTVTVSVDDDSVRIEVRDDGVGGADIERGTGLRGLADRAEALHGALRIESPAGGGTLVAATIPLRR